MRSLVPLGLLSACAFLGCPAAHPDPSRPLADAPASSSARPRPQPLAAPSAPVVLHLEETALPPSAESAPPTAPPTAEEGPDAGAGAPSPGASPGAYRVAALGDSLTDYRSGGGGYLRYLEGHCPESEFVNFGKGGDMVNQMRRRFESDVLSQPPGRFTHLIVFGGVNDLYSDETAFRTPPKIEKDLSAIYAAAHARGWRVVALTVAPWGGFARYFTPHRRATTSELNTWIANGPADRVVDAHALLSCGDPDKLCPDYTPPFKDGLHFGKKGHQVLGETLFRAEFQGCR